MILSTLIDYSQTYSIALFVRLPHSPWQCFMNILTHSNLVGLDQYMYVWRFPNNYIVSVNHIID